MISFADLDKIQKDLQVMRKSLKQRSSGLDSSGYIRESLTPFNDNEDFLADKITDLSNIIETIAKAMKE